MRIVAVAVLLFFQTIPFLVAVWQVMGLLPVLSWFGSPAVTTGMWLAAGIKVAILVVSVVLWWLLGRLRVSIGSRNREARVSAPG